MSARANKHITADEIAGIFGRSTVSIHKWRKDPDLGFPEPVARGPGRTLLFDRKAFWHWVVRMAGLYISTHNRGGRRAVKSEKVMGARPVATQPVQLRIEHPTRRRFSFLRAFFGGARC